MSPVLLNCNKMIVKKLELSIIMDVLEDVFSAK